MPAINLKRYQFSSAHTKIMKSQSVFFNESLKLGFDSVETNDTEYKIEGGCVVEQNRTGEFLFCEAVNVDASLSDADLRRNPRNTISL